MMMKSIIVLLGIFGTLAPLRASKYLVKVAERETSAGSDYSVSVPGKLCKKVRCSVSIRTLVMTVLSARVRLLSTLRASRSARASDVLPR